MLANDLRSVDNAAPHKQFHSSDGWFLRTDLKSSTTRLYSASIRETSLSAPPVVPAEASVSSSRHNSEKR